MLVVREVVSCGVMAAGSSQRVSASLSPGACRGNELAEIIYNSSALEYKTERLVFSVLVFSYFLVRVKESEAEMTLAADHRALHL